MRVLTLKEQELIEQLVLQVKVVPMSPVRRWVGIALVRLARLVLGCKTEIWVDFPK